MKPLFSILPKWLLFLWVVFSGFAVLPFLLPDQLDALARLGFQGLPLLLVGQLQLLEILEFLSLFIPRLLFLLALVRLLASTQIKNAITSEGHVKVRLLITLLLTTVALVINYFPLVLWGWVLFSYYASRITPKPAFNLLGLIAVAAASLMLDLGRGYTLLAAIAYIVGYRGRRNATFIFSIITTLVLAGFLTLIKFGTSDWLSFLNVVQRFGVVNQFIVFLYSDSLNLDPGSGALFDLYAHLPFVRGHLSSIDEKYLFELITGNDGGLAIGFENRALAHWGNWIQSFLDLLVVFSVLFGFIRVTLHLAPLLALPIVLMFPSLVQLDSPYVVAVLLQFIVCQIGLNYVISRIRR